MDVVDSVNITELQEELKKFIVTDSDGKYVEDGEILKEYKALCEKAKPKMEDILAALIIADPNDIKKSDDAMERNARIESWLHDKHEHNVGRVRVEAGNPATRQNFPRGASTAVKREWVKMHLGFDEMVTVLTEVQALESLAGKNLNYADDIDKAKKKTDYKKRSFERAEQLKSDYQAYISKLEAAIVKVETNIANNRKLALDASQPKNKAGQTENSKDLYDKITAEIENDQKLLVQLQTLLKNARNNLYKFSDQIDDIQRESNLSAKSEDKKEVVEEKMSSTPSVKSPYSSLSDRGKQAADSEFAKDLYQSFAAADKYDKFMMITGPDAHNMLEIARNLSKVGDRQDLQEYCKKLLDSSYLNYEGDENNPQLKGFRITLANGGEISFDDINKSDLINGLSEDQVEKIEKLFERLHTINKQNLTVTDLGKLQNYANALLISTTLQEAKWGLGKQITKGFFKIAGRKKTRNYDLGNDVASFLRPFCERKDKIFKEINTQVDKGVSYEDHEKYGPSATLKQNERPIVLRTHDER